MCPGARACKIRLPAKVPQGKERQNCCSTSDDLECTGLTFVLNFSVISSSTLDFHLTNVFL